MLVLILMTMIIFANSWFHLGISKQDLEVFIFPSLFLIYFSIFFPPLRKNFTQQFIKVKSLYRLIALPILLSIIKLFIVYFIDYFPLFLEKKVVSKENHRYVPHEELSTTGQLLLMGVVGPF
jgi:hypothetical protein